MAGQKREREVERARYERQQARRAERHRRNRRRERILASVVVAVLAVGGLAYLGSVLNKDDGSATASTPEDTSSSTNCASPNGQQPTAKTYAKPPAYELDAKKDYAVTLATNCGDIKIKLDAENAPENASAILGLSKAGFYDNTSCHRLTTEGLYVLQCGDPKGDGTGGPGFKLPDENLPKDKTDNYPTGTVAMANAGPGTGGSQFFLVYNDTTLPPNYTVIGEIEQGLDTLVAVAARGTSDQSTDGPPLQPVQILGTTISTSKASS